MPEYRKRKNSDTWHWCTNCSNWPTLAENPDVHSSKPASGGGRDLCNECKAKTKSGECHN